MTTEPTTDVATVDDQTPAAAPSSRRHMLRLAGAAAVGAAAVAVAGTSNSASANLNDPILLGNAGAGGSPGGTLYQSTGQTRADWLPLSVGVGFLFQAGATYNNNQANYPSALAGWSDSTNNPTGVYGYTESGTGWGVVGAGGGTSSTGVLARGAHANLELYPGGAAPTARTDAHRRGEVICDSTGALWFCTTAGTPGTWVNLTAPPSTSGRFFAVTPGRLYDSRGMTPGGPLAKDATRDVVLRDKVNAQTYVLETSNYVPAGAVALAVNVTVVNTVNAGFLSVNPLGDTTVHAATINWSASGQILNNGVTITLGGDRQVTVIAGGNAGSQTDFVIDVTGYYL